MRRRCLICPPAFTRWVAVLAFVLLLTASFPADVQAHSGEILHSGQVLPGTSGTAVFDAPLAQPSLPWDGGGGYLSWLKLLLITIVFLVWVKLADRLNCDSMAIGDDTGMKPEIWNAITTGSFLIGFFVAISLPVFLAGFPIYLLAAFAPPVIYFFMRRSEVKKSPALKARATVNKAGEPVPEPLLQQDLGPEVKFTAAGSGKEQQMNLIRARQTPEEGFTTAKTLIDEAIKSRAEEIMLDYSRDRASVRLKIDGAWQPYPALERPQGDAMLSTFKYLAGLNPAERRAKQTGQFQLKTCGEKCGINMRSQGVATGERIQLKLVRDKKVRLSIIRLGMFPDMAEKFIAHMNGQGMTIISTMPGDGMTTTWQSMLDASDRITRDAVGIIPPTDLETGVENITIHQYDPETGGTPASILKPILLTQPDCLVVPDLSDRGSMDMVIGEVDEGRSVITRIQARSAAEALLRVYTFAGDREAFAENVTAVTNQRLLRRLCDNCKVPVQVAPKMIADLGGDPKQQNTLYKHYKLPPPEQRVDAKGRPIEIPPCEVCNGLSFIGRIAAFEMLEVGDGVRAVLSSGKPTVEAIENAARKAGKKTIAAEAYRLVLMGLTTPGEVQRVLK